MSGRHDSIGLEMRIEAGTERLIREIEAVAGASNVRMGPAVEPYRWDALGSGRGYADFDRLSPSPFCAVRPGNTDEVASIVRLAAAHRTSIVPFGGGSGLMGGAVAVKPSVVVDLTRMDRIIRIDGEGLTAHVEAGTVLQSVNEALHEHGLMLGHDPWTVGIATVGGAIATDSLGYRGARYGSMGQQVLALTAVLPDGRVFSAGSAAKASVGPDLHRLLIGSEGTLGIVTEATLRVFPLPERQVFQALSFPSFESGFAAVLDIDRLMLEPALLDFGESYSQEGVEPPKLYLGFEGFAEGVAACSARARVVCAERGGQALPPEEAEQFWEHRHDIGDRYAERRRTGMSRPQAPMGFDFVHVTLPASQVLGYRERSLDIIRRNRVEPIEIGVWCRPQLVSVVVASEANGDGRERLSKSVDEMLMLAQDLGGSMEYCHGVGLRLAHLMEREHGAGLEVLRAIKRALDPQGIMNPGKLGL